MLLKTVSWFALKMYNEQSFFYVLLYLYAKSLWSSLLNVIVMNHAIFLACSVDCRDFKCKCILIWCEPRLCTPLCIWIQIRTWANDWSSKTRGVIWIAGSNTQNHKFPPEKKTDTKKQNKRMKSSWSSFFFFLKQEFLDRFIIVDVYFHRSNCLGDWVRVNFSWEWASGTKCTPRVW